VSGKEQTQ